MEKDILVKDKIGPDRHVKIEPFRKHVRVTQPHKHKQYFEIVFLSKGGGCHWIDGIRYAVKPPVLFFINRDQIHNWELEGEPEGYVIILKNTFLQQCKDGSLINLLQRVWGDSCLYLENQHELQVLFKLLFENFSGGSVYDDHATDGLMKTLIAAVLKQKGSIGLTNGTNSNLYARYIDLLAGRQDLHHSLQYFAKELHATSQSLNTACQKSAGKTASEILRDHIINEARRLLLYTDKHVGEIAHLLHFNDSSYFVKFFKRYLGATPEEFRRRRIENRQH